MQPKLLKFILDIESVIDELEQVKVKAMNDFTLFKADILLQRAAERGLEIIGEAVRKIRDNHPEVKISAAAQIIGLRNLIAHAYDTVEPEMIWAIIMKDIPTLKTEILEIKKCA